MQVTESIQSALTNYQYSIYLIKVVEAKTRLSIDEAMVLVELGVNKVTQWHMYYMNEHIV